MYASQLIAISNVGARSDWGISGQNGNWEIVRTLIFSEQHNERCSRDMRMNQTLTRLQGHMCAYWNGV